MSTLGEGDIGMFVRVKKKNNDKVAIQVVDSVRKGNQVQ
jgi:hypothetical protein